MNRLVFPLVLLLLGYLPSRALAGAPGAPQSFTSSTDIPVAGGTGGLAGALGITPPPPAVFISELARHIYGVPEGKNDETDRLLGVLAGYLDVADRFQAALARVQPDTGGIALSLATRKNERKRLQEFLDLIGLKLREQDHRFTVQRSTDKRAAERLRLLESFELDPADLARRLNAGDAVRVTVPVEHVPLALDAGTWSRVILEQAIKPDQLFGAILRDRRAALLAYGLAWLDDETLLFLARNPSLLRRLYEDHAALFAAFARSLRVKDDRVIVPGGDSAGPLWEQIVGEPRLKPDRFVRNLFGRQDGRVAYLYDTIASLDAPHARFALGLWIDGLALRNERFAALAAATAGAYSEYQPHLRPFLRAPMDVTLLLARVAVEPDGTPSPPNARRLWEKAYGDLDLPGEPARQLRNLRQDGPIDAAWLAEQVMPREMRGRAERLDLLSFGQRAFRGAPESALPDVLTALRGFTRLKMLMLSLDRMNITDPAIYAAAARRATELTALEHNRAFAALSQFQSAIALVGRLRDVRAVDAAGAGRLVHSLVSVDLADGRYRGGVARWIDEQLVAAIPVDAPPVPVDDRLIAGLAGISSSSPGARHPQVTWEGRDYHLDLAGAEIRRLTAVRKRQGAYSLEQVLTLARELQRLSALDAAASVADVRQRTEAIRIAGAPFRREKTAPPEGTDPPRDPRRTIDESIRDLGRISKPKDVRKAANEVDPLSEVCDSLLGDVLRSYAYALAVGDPDGTVLLGGDPARRHDFGFAILNEEARRRAPWQLPAAQIAVGTQWHVEGSVLALDVGLSSLALRRIAADRMNGRPDLVSGNDRTSFSANVALLDAFDLSDGDRDEIAAALSRGRSVLSRLERDDQLTRLFAAADGPRLDGLRQRAARWTLAHAPESVATWWTLADTLRMGKPAETVNLDAWGTSGVPLNACLCTRFPDDMSWHVFTGQNATGLLPTRVADLNLRVAEISAELKIPAALARGILSAAVLEYLDDLQPSDFDDWMSFVRLAGSLTRERVEDYVAALTADGTLAPAVQVRAPDAGSRW